MRSILCFAVVAVLAMPVTAQSSRYSPARYEKVEGNTASSWPLVYYSKSTNPAYGQIRYMQVHDDLGKTPMAIKAISFRKDGSSYNFWTTPAYKVTLELDMSTAATTGASISRTFNANHGNDKITVISKKTISIPPVPTVPGTPQPDAFLRLAFDKPFPFRRGSLCWDMKVHSSTYGQVANRSFSLDRAYQSNSPSSSLYGFRDRYGKACYGSWPYHTPPYMYAYSYLSRSTQQITMYMYMYYMPPGNAPAAFMIGVSDKKMGSVPLPFDLSPLGAPGCYILQSMDASIPVMTDTTGYARYPQTGNLTLPNNPWYEGKALYFQAVSLADKNANALGVVTSSAYVSYFPIVYQTFPANYVYRTGPTAFTSPTGYGGSSSYGYAVITGFHQ